MSRKGTTLVTAAVWTLLALQSAFADTQNPAAPPATAPDTRSSQSTTVPVSEIPGRLLQTAALIRRANSHVEPLESIQEIEKSLPDYQEGIRALLAFNRETIGKQMSPRAAQELKKGWAIIRRKLGGWQDLLEGRSRSLQQDIEALAAEARTWNLARESAAAQQVPEALQAQIAGTSEGIRQAEQSVLARRNVVLKLQSDVSRLSISVEETVELLDAALEAARGQLLQLDAPPIWRSPPELKAPGNLEVPKLEWSRSSGEVVQYYLVSTLEFLAIELSAFVLLLAVLLLIKKKAAVFQRDDDELIRHLGFVIRRPFSTSILLTVVGGTIATAAAPTYLLSLGWYALLIPLVRIVPGVSPRGMKPFLWVIVGLYLAAGALAFLPPYSTVARVVVVLITLIAMGGFVLYERQIRSWKSGSRWKRLVQFGFRVGIALLAIAFLGEIFGATNLSRYLENAVLGSVSAGAAFYASLLILRGFVQLLLRSPETRNGSHWEMPADLKRAFSNGLTWIAAVLYGALLLRTFQLWGVLLARTTLILQYQVSIGALRFTIGSAFAFLTVLFAATVFSRVFRIFLTAELHTHIEAQRGKTEAISRLAHYTILTIGFLLAVGASGMDLNKFAFLAGALGVGVGFGLQNVVNNFVSGLILLFERPLHVGDKISVGDTSGEVKDIGIRASTIATLDGADVIIPNASLISGNVTNWTLTDTRRRSELKVGVAYGTSPQAVLRILRETALAHPLVLSVPEPVTLFIGFGDSSLDFCICYWTLLEHSVDVSSQLHVALCERLAAEGIEIPFPQRELHLKDVDPSVLESLMQSRIAADSSSETAK